MPRKPQPKETEVESMMEVMLSRSYVEFRGLEPFSPAINLYESKQSLHVCIDLAGVDRESIDVRCAPRVLTVQGHRPRPNSEGVGAVSVHEMEIPDGPFKREIDLPEDVAVDHVKASYDKGYLWITLPKTK
ncbi:MAG: Hsp20/alpha crystallin family protein [Phycisphaerales bacterium]|nr:Hsp20/alpha crystallin family protein [Phycisphaerales bacterium]